MKIAQIGPYPQSADCIKGGVEASVFGLAHELAKQNDVVCIDIPRMDQVADVEQSGNVKVYRYHNPGMNQKDMVTCFSEILSDIEKEEPDICHIHGTGLLAYLLYRELRKRGMKLMLTIHGLLYIEKKNQLKQHFSLRGLYKLYYQSKAEFALLRMASQAIVDTDYVREALSHYPCRIPELFTIPQGINERYFRIRCSKESKTILSVGSIGMRKGHLYTIEAFNMLRSRGVDAKLKIYGVLAEQDYYERIKTAVSVSPYREDIELHPNAPLSELMQAYVEAHIFALHSQEESQGIVFAEAMACGLPIVATNVGGIPFVVDNGVCGLLADYADVDAMVANMQKLLCDAQYWKAMSESAKTATRRYSWRNISSEVMGLYDKK